MEIKKETDRKKCAREIVLELIKNYNHRQLFMERWNPSFKGISFEAFLAANGVIVSDLITKNYLIELAGKCAIDAEYDEAQRRIRVDGKVFD